MPNIMEELRRTVVFLGKIDEEGLSHPTLEEVYPVNFTGTGFIIRARGVLHLVTAKHVIYGEEEELNDENLLVFFNTDNGGYSIEGDKQELYLVEGGNINFRAISQVKEEFDVEWIFHAERDDVDIAVIPIPFDVDNDDVRALNRELFIEREEVHELRETFFYGYQPGSEHGSMIAPVLRSGMVSRKNEDGSMLIDFHAFPGNSGSPVFIKPSIVRWGGEERDVSGNFVGVVGSYMPYNDVAISQQTGEPRVIFQENTGLSTIWPTDYLVDIITSDAFESQLERLVENDRTELEDVPEMQE